MKKLLLSAFALFMIHSAGFSQFSLPSLTFKYNELEPYIDSVTMRIHYSAHHAAYVNNLNKALEKQPDLYKKDLAQLLKNLNTLPKDVQTAVRNNGGGHYNHSLFWSLLAPAGSTSLSKEVEKALISNFGSVEKFKELFEKESLGRFGSGWVWLIKTPDGKLKIVSTANQDNPEMTITNIKGKPILTLDVWEHAYYLKYQQKRAAYVKAFWNVVNWNKVDELYKK